jgi:D-alanyl-lipoteichoic acid acyltransferase DltB (MBOAT superfamily)
MLFNSFEFVVFFTTFVVIFMSVPRRVQPLVLLIGSYIFYMGWRPSFALLLALTTVVDYTTALQMARAKTQSGRRVAMIVALSINLGVLGTVKYADFLISNVLGIVGFFGSDVPDFVLGLVLPLGISFYTFQSIGYTLDVYNRRIEAERDFLTYAQYVSFFPQLIAGPIERAGHMLPQFQKCHRLEYQNVTSGLWLIGYGLFKKMCVADAVAPVVASIYASPESYTGSYNLLAMLLFALQVYCDFSGYSDIARGCARILGFDLMINFRQPYFATSLADFWHRWHISLSSWFRDYLYIPVGGSRGGELMTVRNLLIVFLVSGIWHGAAWTFVIWGGLHGICLIAERLFVMVVQPKEWMADWASRPLGWLWTITVVLVGWVFFRASSLPNALVALQSLTHFGDLSYGTFKMAGLASFEIVMLGVSILTLFIVDYVIAFRAELLQRLQRMPRLSTAAGVGLAYYILLFGIFGRVEFIYFQF